jgi:hypothetical protein
MLFAGINLSHYQNFTYMSEPTSKTILEQLTIQLNEKRALYNSMINDNKEFDQVKTLFMEIKSLETMLSLPVIQEHSFSGE